MVKHTTERVFSVTMCGGVLHGLGDGNAQAAGCIRVGGQDPASGVGAFGGGGENFGTPDMHERPTVGLLVVAGFHHVDSAAQTEELAGERHRGTPLARARFGA